MLLCYILEVYIYIYIYIYVVIFYLFNDWTHTIIDYCSQSILSKINFKSSNHLIYFYEVFVYIFRYKIYEKYLCLFWNETLKECPINQFNQTTPHFLPVPRQDLSTSYAVVFFMFSVLRSEVIVRFVDIGGIVDHHYLSFLFII